MRTIQSILVLCSVLHMISCNAITPKIIYPPDSSSTRIVGGTNATPGLAPYQCSMQMYRSHYCGCVILSENWILTAGHCVDGQRPKDVQIFAGSIDLTSGGSLYKVEKFYKHPQFNAPMFSHDIGLARLQSPLQFNENVQPIEYITEEVEDGADVLLTGWGRIKAGGALPKILQQINLTLVSTEKCKKIYDGVNVHNSHICTFTRQGEGACNGDSGGPLVFQNKLIGLVNFGVPCAMGYPDAYAKLAYLYNWVEQIVKMDATYG